MKYDFSCLKLYSLSLGFLFLCDLQVHGQNENKFSETSSGKRLVDIGTHKLFITEKGNRNAKFTVVFESGAGGVLKIGQK